MSSWDDDFDGFSSFHNKDNGFQNGSLSLFAKHDNLNITRINLIWVWNAVKLQDVFQFIVRCCLSLSSLASALAIAICFGITVGGLWRWGYSVVSQGI